MSDGELSELGPSNFKFYGKFINQVFTCNSEEFKNLLVHWTSLGKEFKNQCVHLISICLKKEVIWEVNPTFIEKYTCNNKFIFLFMYVLIIFCGDLYMN